MQRPEHYPGVRFLGMQEQQVPHDGIIDRTVINDLIKALDEHGGRIAMLELAIERMSWRWKMARAWNWCKKMVGC